MRSHQSSCPMNKGRATNVVPAPSEAIAWVSSASARNQRRAARVGEEDRRSNIRCAPRRAPERRNSFRRSITASGATPSCEDTVRMLHSATAMSATPVVSCVMPTSNRHWFGQRALAYFLRANDPEFELIVVDDGDEPFTVPSTGSGNIRCIRLERRASVGTKRNLACEHARGTFIAHWDDDDWYAPWRVRYQIEDLKRAGADVGGLDRLLYYEPLNERAWEYAHPRKRSAWVAGNTLCYRKSVWKQHPFADIDVGEDFRFVSDCDPARIHRHARTDFIVAIALQGQQGCLLNP